MEKQETLRRLRHAAGLVARPENPLGDPAPLLEAWKYLQSLRGDDFPEELRATFSFLEREISRAESEDLSAREIAFLSSKIQKLELLWTSLAS